MKISKDLQEKLRRLAGDSERPRRQKAVKASMPLRGQQRKFVSIRLPWPPSVNECYIPVAKGKIILSKRGKQYPKTVMACCFEQQVDHVAGTLRMTIWAYPPKDGRKHDCDNLLKSTQDGLQKCGVFRDDSDIVEIRIFRGPPLGIGYLNIQIEGDMP